LRTKRAGPIRKLLLDGEFVAIHDRQQPIVFFQHSRWGSEDRAPVYGEFLAPLEGSECDRAGRPKDAIWVQDGLVAMPLRYVQLLLHDPLSISSGAVPGFDPQEDIDVRIPNPASYILQKALVLEKRPPLKQRKDLAYVFETAALWYEQGECIRSMVDSISSQSPEWARWVERGERILFDGFETAESDGAVSAELDFGSPVRAATVSLLTTRFLEAVFTPR